MKLKKRFVNLLMLFLFSYNVSAQAVDSLKQTLHQSQNLSDEQKAKINLDIARHLVMNCNLKESLDWLENAQALSKDSTTLAKCYRVKAQVKFQLEDFSETESAARLALSYIGKHDEHYDRIESLNMLGLAASFTGRYQEGFKYFYEALYLAQKFDSPYESAVVTVNLGVHYYKVDDYRMAIRFFTRASELGLDDNSMYFVLSNLALANCHFGDLGKARYHLDRLFSKGDRSLPKVNIINGYYAYGVVLQKQAKPDSAEYCFNRSLYLADSLQNLRFKAENLLSLGEIYLTRMDFRNASSLLQRAESIARANFYEDILLRTLKQQILLAEKTSDRDLKLLSQRQYIEKKAALYNTVLAQLIGRRKALFFEKEYEFAIERHHQILQQNEEQAHAARTLSTIQFFIVVLLACILLLLFYSLKINKENQLSLERVIEERTKLEITKIQELGRLVEDGYALASSRRTNFVSLLKN